MILDNKYKIELVIVENIDGVPGKVYDDMREFKEKCPHSSYRFGFCVVDTETHCIPEGCNDWNDSPEEALHDYFDNVAG